MLALRDIDQGKLDYFQQDHSHLQIIHAALDRGKYSDLFSYIILRLKNDIFWNVTLCSLVEVYIHFRGLYCLEFKF
jgi:hypothetical protein